VGPTILEGISVLEFGRMVSAPYCAKLLADLGADVVKLERPGSGDPARRVGPFPDDEPHPERSGLFLYLNTGKRGVTLDLEREEGRRVLRQLVEKADVLIEDATSAELDAFGLGYRELSKLNPRLILTSLTPFGRIGPYRDYKTYHLNLYHAAGQTSFSYGRANDDTRPPPRGGGHLGEYDAGLTAAVGTMAAVLARGRTGRGQHVDVTALEALMCIERVDIGRLTNPVEQPQSWGGFIGGMLKAKDGYVMITPAQNHQFQGLVRAMGSPEWATADWCGDEVKRIEHRDEIQPKIEAWAAELTRDEIYRRTQAEGTPAGPVRNPAEVMAWPQAEARGFFAELDHPEAGSLVYPTLPYRFSGSEWTGHAAPLLGQHTRDVYCRRLGCSAADLDRLASEGVI
jgi:crotonobetainyl-CoA:carnitine CoA-transferase CaiB-like acyl-CoA transferase